MRVFKDERGQVVTKDELSLEFIHLDAKNETECETFLEYTSSCTGRDGTLTEYEVPQYDDTVVLNTLISEDEKLSEWYTGEKLKITLVDLPDWKCWVSGYKYPVSIDYVSVLMEAGNEKRIV